MDCYLFVYGLKCHKGDKNKIILGNNDINSDKQYHYNRNNPATFDFSECTECTEDINKFEVDYRQIFLYLLDKFKLDKKQIIHETKEYVINNYQLPSCTKSAKK
jgi:hypothetical protein